MKYLQNKFNYCRGVCYTLYNIKISIYLYAIKICLEFRNYLYNS